ncbi:putative bifunctional diguanylate cyclase/phosphodiesterase [Saccharopolyspora mangrovi]|uniref:Diguanylate cyclase n=1 Tax=Saccharopolyspora mangrovi TaxID=3082379 RepID=A0ABU6A817_9PSEU|nr:diguanylate cyclase [Saccharopolyspora sp. S2-29]MEB3367648.1 diguanylate cyclase [Saccharopolyspora sp. S2-29]
MPETVGDPDIEMADRSHVAAQWTREIIHTSYVAMGRPEIEAFLAKCFDDVLAACDGPLESARLVGERLVEVHFTNPVVVRKTLDHLASVLLRYREVDQARLVQVLGAVGSGFAGALREQTLDEQEIIKQSVLDARDAAEEALRASEARSRAVFTSSALGIAIAGLDGVIDEINPSMTRIFQLGNGSLVGRTIFDLADTAWIGELVAANAELVRGEVDRYQLEIRFTEQHGSHIWTQLSASLVRDARGAPDYLVMLYEDITDRHMLQEQFRRQAVHDPLTGLANRTQLQTSMERALDPTHPGRRVGLCFFDLDGFKAVNDSLGHPVGDQLLRAVAQRLQALTAEFGALAARMGGDEFVVLVPDTAGAAGLVSKVEKMLAEVTRPARIGAHELAASASVGVVERPVAGADAESLLRDADVTLYRAKQDGRAQWVLFDADLNAEARDRFKLSAALPAALDQGELFVEYEPVRLLDDRALFAAAAGIRWDHPEFGELGEESFLDLAEETGLITRLGSWALEEVCRHAAHWFERFGERGPIAAMNLSHRHCRDPELVNDVQQILRETGLSPESLALGMPESALFDHQGDAVDTVEIFAEMGIKLIVYQFGDDYTRVARLRGLPLFGVRIDGPHLAGFADPEGPDPLDEYLLGAAAGAAALMDLPVVAGGVHDELQAERLRALGVRSAIGAFAGERVSALELEELIADSE